MSTAPLWCAVSRLEDLRRVFERNGLSAIARCLGTARLLLRLELEQSLGTARTSGGALSAVLVELDRAVAIMRRDCIVEQRHYAELARVRAVVSERIPPAPIPVPSLSPKERWHTDA